MANIYWHVGKLSKQGQPVCHTHSYRQKGITLALVIGIVTVDWPSIMKTFHMPSNDYAPPHKITSKDITLKFYDPVKCLTKLYLPTPVVENPLRLGLKRFA